MNARAQFSLDLLLAIVSVFTFLLILQALSAGISSNALTQSALFQEKNIAFSTANIVLHASSLAANGETRIQFIVPSLQLPRSNPANCQVSITSNEIRVAANVENQSLTYAHSFALPAVDLQLPASPIACGELLVLEGRPLP